MQKNYLLLRHNQQSGPYSLEELTCMPLQAKDLIWIIGQSTGWRYPEEIDALKAGITGEPLPATAVMPSGTPKQEQHSLSEDAPQTAHQNLPPRHIYVSLPTATIIPSQPAAEPASTSSFEERVEKLRQRVTDIDKSHNTDPAPEVETKYSRSLEDIKAEYTTWMQTQKNNRIGSRSGKQVARVAVIFLAAIGAFWLGSQVFFRSSGKELVQNTVDQASEKIFYPTVVLPPAPVTSNYEAKQEKRALPHDESRITKKATTIKKEVLSHLDTQAVAPDTTLSETVVTKAKGIDEVSTGDSVHMLLEKPKTVAEQLHINAEYVAGKQRSSGVEGLAVTVKNNSTQVMKVVAVDVIYFTDGMNELERKTLYFSNLHPGQVLTRNAPAHQKAQGAYAQLGLISSEEGSIFYASNK